MGICCFTGHRTLPPSVAVALCHALDRHIEALAARDVTEFRTGGALGFDTLAALRVIDAREKNPALRLVLYLPCRTQSDSWREGERALYADILSRADEVHYVSDVYTAGCMHMRNRALVEDSDVCLAYLTKSRGGTYQTFAYALSRGVTVVNLADEI